MPGGTWAWDSLEGHRRSRNSGPGEGCMQHSPLLLPFKLGSDCLGPRSLWWPGLGPDRGPGLIVWMLSLLGRVPLPPNSLIDILLLATAYLLPAACRY